MDMEICSRNNMEILQFLSLLSVEKISLDKLYHTHLVLGLLEEEYWAAVLAD